MNEVRAQVIECIGLTADQFQRVILLPQGDFEQFLTARGDDRRPLLRQLFGSGVFDRAVSKLKEAANEAVMTADAVRDELERYRFAALEQLAAAEERLGAEPIDDEAAGGIGLAERLAVVERATAQMHCEWQQAERAAEAAAESAATARDVARRWRLRAERRCRAEALEAERPGREAERSRLVQARRSVPARRALDAHAAATVAADEAVAARAGADRAVADSLAALGVAAKLDDAPALRRRLHADALQAERLVALRVEWKAALAAREAAADEDGRAQRALATATAAVAACDAEIVRRRAQLEQLDGAGEARQAAEIAADGAAQALGRRRELATAEEQLHRLHERAADARLAYDHAVADHMTATAPRLAEQLRDGEPCSVCGSREHPAPARAPASARPPQVSIDDVDAHRADAEAACTERDRQLGMVESWRASLGADAARSIDELSEAAEAAAGELGRAAAAAARQGSLAVALVELDERRASITTDEQRAAHAAATRAAELVAAASEVARIEASLAGCGAAHDDPVRWQRELTTAASALDERDLTAVAERDAATRLAVLQVAMEEALAASGFADATEARAAAMNADDLDRREQLLAEWDAAVRDLAAVLNEPEHDLPEVPPDTEASEDAAAQARALSHDRSNCHAALAVHRDSAAASIEAMGSRQAELDAAIRAAEVATTVLDRCAGRMMPRIPLENWVLGVELERVAEAANVHLGAMTSGRYRLQRATNSFDARSGAGLDLEVADAHTGTTRRTTSLSGGERFQASLALALGLADVVTSGAAATCRTLDALFVDEGFGSLDADALDQAIAALDRLRHHGRQIGVITHVEAMKAALTVGIEVRPLPGHGGSTIRQPVLAR
jgi:exonuclease SbcC